MKFARLGAVGAERPALFSEGSYLDISEFTEEIGPCREGAGCGIRRVATTARHR
jgi:hypothetical protein